MIREIRENELQNLMNLYSGLHEDELPEINEDIQKAWQQILNDPNHYIIVAEESGELIASCVCVIIPNLTRQGRPYALVENVITNAKFRRKGYASACLTYAKDLARQAGCYKMMLLTGSKDPNTLNFYKQAGYNADDKTAFIQWL